MRKVLIQTCALLALSAMWGGFGREVQAARYYYQPVAVVPAVPVYSPVVPAYYAAPAGVYVAGPAYGAPVYAAPATIQPVAAVVQPAPVVVAPSRVVQRGLFRTTKATVTGPPGYEQYNYRVHRFLAPNYRYTVQNNMGNVSVYERGR